MPDKAGTRHAANRGGQDCERSQSPCLRIWQRHPQWQIRHTAAKLHSKIVDRPFGTQTIHIMRYADHIGICLENSGTSPSRKFPYRFRRPLIVGQQNFPSTNQLLNCGRESEARPLAASLHRAAPHRATTPASSARLSARSPFPRRMRSEHRTEAARIMPFEPGAEHRQWRVAPVAIDRIVYRSYVPPNEFLGQIKVNVALTLFFQTALTKHRLMRTLKFICGTGERHNDSQDRRWKARRIPCPFTQG
jgi:hypothetical protein